MTQYTRAAASDRKTSMFLKATVVVLPPALLLFRTAWIGWPSGKGWCLPAAVLVAWIAVCLVISLRQVSRRREVVAVALLGVAMIVNFLGFYNPATNWLHGDDYFRALMAVELAHGPSVHSDHEGCGWCRGEPVWLLEHDGPFVYPGDLSWLPLQFYIYGAFVPFVNGNLHLGFTVLSQLLGFATVVMLYMLARELFSPCAAIASAAILTLTSWHIIVSLSCLAEPLYYLLAISTLYWLNRWLREDRTWQLAVLAAIMVLLAMTRYEAWILVGLVCPVAAFRLISRHERSRLAWIGLITPWILPALWCIRSFQLRGHVLNYYNVNRFWFEDSIGEWSTMRRMCTYPEALYDISHPLLLLFVLAVALGRWLLDRRAALLCAVNAAHLGVLVLLFVLGSAPLFVERIVLFHFALIVPIAANLFCQLARRLPTAVGILGAGLLMIYGVEQLERAHTLFDSGRCCDHSGVRGPYAELGTYLRSCRTDLGGQVVVADDDRDHIIGVISSLPRRVRTINSPEDVPVLCSGDVEIFCVPIRDLGRGWVGPAVEQAFLGRNAAGSYDARTIGPWRVYALLRPGGQGATNGLDHAGQQPPP